MKIQCQKYDLLNSVNIVLKAVPTKSTMPILECLIIEAKDNSIKLIANDMELGIETLVRNYHRKWYSSLKCKSIF